MNNIFSDLLKLIGSIIPIFGGFLYYIGRRFTESYYETLGIPSEALNFSLADYLSRSMQSWMFLIAIALTYLLFIMWKSIIKKQETQLETPTHLNKKKERSNIFVTIGKGIKGIFSPEKGDPKLMMIFLFLYGIFAAVLLMVWILPTAEPNFPAEAFSIIMILFLSIYQGWLILTDEPTIEFIRKRKRLKYILVGCVVFTVIISMQLLPHGIGRLVGIMQTDPNSIEQKFPEITIYSDKPLCSGNITWDLKNGIYESQDKFVLLLHNGYGIFVKEIIEGLKSKQISDTYFIPESNIEGLIINIPGKLSTIENYSGNNTDPSENLSSLNIN